MSRRGRPGATAGEEQRDIEVSGGITQRMHDWIKSKRKTGEFISDSHAVYECIRRTMVADEATKASAPPAHIKQV